jgi:hypothetical protein
VFGSNRVIESWRTMLTRRFDFPRFSKRMDAAPEPFERNEVFLLVLEGHKIVTPKLPNRVAEEISSQEPQTSGGFLGRLKAKLGFISETERQLTDKRS